MATPCIACGHSYDRSEHDDCPGCQHESLTEYPAEPESES